MLFAWALAGTMGHLALVRHEICAEHGALVERWGAGHDPHGHDARGHNAPEDAGAEHEHEPQKHCSLLACASGVPAAPAIDVGPAVVFVRALVDVQGAVLEERRSRPLLAVAPKTSPPAG